MKHLFKIAGLCLASMLVIGMALTGTASAAPHWVDCVEVEEGKGKFENSLCVKEGGKKDWEYKEVIGTELVKIKGSLALRDTKVPILGTSEVVCSGESEGVVGPGIVGKITKVTVSPSQCEKKKVCENVEEIEARHLPWNTELVEVGGKLEEILKSGTGGEPGWRVKCKVPIKGPTVDECTSVAGEPESLLLENKVTSGVSLVLATFQKLRNATCTVGGSKAGVVEGSLAILLASGGGLLVSK